MKTIAATPVAPRTRGIAMWPAPLFLELAEPAVGVALDLTVDPADADPLCVVSGLEAVAEVGVAAAPDPEEGAAEPEISDWTVELNWPVMLVRLFQPVRGKLESKKRTRHT